MIKLSINTREDKNWDVRITSQNLITYNFYKNTNTFTASNGIILISDAYPNWYYDNCIYVRGSEQDKDNRTMTLRVEMLPRFIDAVNQYNAWYTCHMQTVLNFLYKINVDCAYGKNPKICEASHILINYIENPANFKNADVAKSIMDTGTPDITNSDNNVLHNRIVKPSTPRKKFRENIKTYLLKSKKDK